MLGILLLVELLVVSVTSQACDSVQLEVHFKTVTLEPETSIWYVASV